MKRDLLISLLTQKSEGEESKNKKNCYREPKGNNV